MKTFQFELKPNNKQIIMLWKHANKLNYIYNYFLNQRIEAYKNNIKIGRKEQQAELVKLKEQEYNDLLIRVEDKILNQIYSQVLQQVPLRLKLAYETFFRENRKNKGSGFPRFRSCKNFFGITYPQSGFKIKDNYFVTKAYGEINFIKHRDIQGAIKQVNISYKKKRYYLNIVTDYLEPKTNGIKEIGIDIGISDLVVTNTGIKTKNVSHAKYFDKQISKLQSLKDKLKKGSRKVKFLQKVINRLYDVKIRKINDFQHKVSRNLSRNYDIIYAENLSIKKMSESEKTGLNKANRNARFSTFLNYLGYKVNKLILVNPYNTSKTCNDCGAINENLKLKDRIINCKCGITFDRDINAAKNILCLGQAINNNLCSEFAKIQEAISFRRQ